MVTAGAPFSMRWSVTREMPAASAAATALMPRSLRRWRTRAPMAVRMSADRVVSSGLEVAYEFLILYIQR